MHYSSLSGKVYTELVDWRGKEIVWKEIGFSVSIPGGAIPEGQSVKIAVCPHQSSPLDLPQNLKLVSPAFLIAVSPDTPFTKPVQISINASHEVNIKSITFVITHKPLPAHHEETPKPCLRVLQGGDFNSRAGVGTVTLDCLPAIIAIAVSLLSK